MRLNTLPALLAVCHLSPVGASALITVGALDTPGSARDVEVVGDLAYVVDEDSGLRIIDVSNPTSPVEIGALETPEWALDVEVVGDVAYVADGYSGLRVIDASNPALPVEIGALDTYAASDVEVVGDLAYVAGGGLHVIDVSNPASPVEIGALDTPGVAYRVEMVGDLAYVAAAYPGSLHIVDVSNPALPVEIGALDTPGPFHIDPPPPPSFPRPINPQDVEVVGGLAYVADRGSGLRIIDFGPEYAQTITIDLDIKPGSDPNAINPTSRGVIPVAILGSDSFDVADVDATTLAFGSGEAAPAHRSGGHPEDVNDDGYTDWVSHYRIEEVAVAAGDTELCLTGQTLDGTPFEGCDAIVTVPYVGERRRVRVNRHR